MSIEISEPVMRDLLSAKAKLTDIRALIETAPPYLTQKELRQRIARIVYSAKYMDKEVEHESDYSHRKPGRRPRGAHDAERD